MLRKLCLRFVSAFFVFGVICVRLLNRKKAPVSKGFECLSGRPACRISVPPLNRTAFLLRSSSFGGQKKAGLQTSPFAARASACVPDAVDMKLL
jgi:hypothetical protein